MMDLAGFALAVVLIELTPGPNMGWLISLTLTEGRRAGLAAIWGIALGLAGNAVVSALAASFILGQSALLARGIAVLGAGMMGWLAWQAWRAAGESSAASTPRDSAHGNFLAGLTINLLNPKASLFFLTVMPQFVAGGQPSYSQSLALASVSVAIATAVHLVLIVGAGQLRPYLIGSRREGVIRRVLALGMVGVGVWFLVKAFA